MNELLVFKVGIEGLEDKIWREIEIPSRRTVADLAYTILATFDSLAYHLYNIKYKDYIFDCWVSVEDNPNYEDIKNATAIKLSSLELKDNDELEMEYDYGSTTNFKITFICKKNLDSYNAYLYPKISDGFGRGMLDDMCDFELKEIVDDTDKKGYSEFYVTPGYEKHEIYDYRKFNLKENNRKLKGMILEIKNGYEVSSFD
jgi:hypothetical protein